MYTKKCELLQILVLSGIHSHTLQYIQKVHTTGANIRDIIGRVLYNVVDD